MDRIEITDPFSAILFRERKGLSGDVSIVTKPLLGNLLCT